MHDILILGGGLVGNSLACALKNSGLSLGLVEASVPSLGAPGFNERKLALSAASLIALERLSVSQHFAQGFSPIRRIHISRVGDFGSVDIQAKDYDREYFGGVVLARDLGVALETRVAELKNLSLYRPAKVLKVIPDALNPSVLIEYNGKQQTLSARMLIGADGTQSIVRSALNIATDDFDYQQHLFVCSLQTDQVSDGTAFERFSAQGPVALLPMPGGQFGAICGVANEQVKQIENLSDTDYIDYFQQRFGWRAGRIKRVGTRTHYPLKKVIAKAIIGPGCVLMGNAAQTLHPIGAQGFNLGLRDALSFAECLQKQELQSPELLLEYRNSRHEDREQTIAFSDGLARFTAQENSLAKTIRSLGFLGLGLSPDLQEPIVNGAMGYRGKTPRLALRTA
ncbi:MAG: 2-octaprenyl-6-methoxyphenyl hydroxylase [Arenimonas sp.]